MDIKEAQDEAWKIIEEYNKKHGLDHKKDTVFYHLIEEVGELARELYAEKNNWRGEFNKEKFEDELADVFAQLLFLAKDYDVDIEAAFKRKVTKTRKKLGLD